jgi:hypothetical protein
VLYFIDYSNRQGARVPYDNNGGVKELSDELGLQIGRLRGGAAGMHLLCGCPAAINLHVCLEVSRVSSSSIWRADPCIVVYMQRAFLGLVDIIGS